MCLPLTLGPGDVVSLEVSVPRTHPQLLREVQLRGRPIGAHFAGRNKDHVLVVTDRFEVSGAEDQLNLLLAGRFASHDDLEVVLVRWRRSAA